MLGMLLPTKPGLCRSWGRLSDIHSGNERPVNFLILIPAFSCVEKAIVYAADVLEDAFPGMARALKHAVWVLVYATTIVVVVAIVILKSHIVDNQGYCFFRVKYVAVDAQMVVCTGCHKIKARRVTVQTGGAANINKYGRSLPPPS
jgi:hypothetical protein